MKILGILFNKSHGTCYAYLSAMTSWLKYHYPSEFMAALMTSVANNKDKIARYIKHCSDLGIKVLPPSINQSDLDLPHNKMEAFVLL